MKLDRPAGGIAEGTTCCAPKTRGSRLRGTARLHTSGPHRHDLRCGGSASYPPTMLNVVKEDALRPEHVLPGPVTGSRAPGSTARGLLDARSLGSRAVVLAVGVAIVAAVVASG